MPLLTLLKMPAADDIDDTDDVENSLVWVRETPFSPTWVRSEENDG